MLIAALGTLPALPPPLRAHGRTPRAAVLSPHLSSNEEQSRVQLRGCLIKRKKKKEKKKEKHTQKPSARRFAPEALSCVAVYWAMEKLQPALPANFLGMRHILGGSCGPEPPGYSGEEATKRPRAAEPWAKRIPLSAAPVRRESGELRPARGSLRRGEADGAPRGAADSGGGQPKKQTRRRNKKPNLKS